MTAQVSWSRRLLRDALRHPAVLVAVVLWMAANVAVLLLADGRLPFDRPALATLPFAQQVALPRGAREVGLVALDNPISREWTSTVPAEHCRSHFLFPDAARGAERAACGARAVARA